jgi:hypothetical protein
MSDVMTSVKLMSCFTFLCVKKSGPVSAPAYMFCGIDSVTLDLVGSDVHHLLRTLVIW